MKKEALLVSVFLCCASAVSLGTSVAHAEGDFKSLDEDDSRRPASSSKDSKKDDGEEAVTEAPVPKLLDAKEAAAAEAKEASAKGWVTFSAAVNTIRKDGRSTQIMFRNGESYYLPSGSKHNQFFKICEESERSGGAVSVTANPNSRTIVTMSGASSNAGDKQK